MSLNQQYQEKELDLNINIDIDIENENENQNENENENENFNKLLINEKTPLVQSQKSNHQEEKNKSKDYIVSIKNVHKTYLIGTEGFAALRGVSLNIKRGEFVVIYGKSGSGKTTLLNIIGTIDSPTKGSLTIFGTKISPKTPDKILAQMRLNKIGFVFQSFNLMNIMNAVENVEFPMVLKAKETPSKRKQFAKEYLKHFGMEKRYKHTPSKLSGGEQQRVTISRAIANSPELLLLDEPTGDLDSANTNILLRRLLELNKNQKMTMVMVTHDINLKDFADRALWIRDGLIISEEIISEKRKKRFRKEILQKVDSQLKENLIENQIENQLENPNNFQIESDFEMKNKQSEFEIQPLNKTLFRKPNYYQYCNYVSSKKQ
ncbi:abc transporter h family member 2 [Anaeramoeba ignava]|uniref:Abc transporter h family member 2 n=1 Tax=Anaeramoeba ignava TaxID=1746090 RepID=A0A9Q0LJS3_ANAIG|nr:abc transporter h family member 2 [Anaeramoeba ignava]